MAAAGAGAPDAASATGQSIVSHLASAFARGAVALPELGNLYKEDSIMQAEAFFASGLAAIGGIISSRVCVPCGGAKGEFWRPTDPRSYT